MMNEEEAVKRINERSWANNFSKIERLFVDDGDMYFRCTYIKPVTTPNGARFKDITICVTESGDVISVPR